MNAATSPIDPHASPLAGRGAVFDPTDPLPGSRLEPLEDTDADRSVARLAGAVKRFGKVTALAGIDFEIRPGELVALLGPNGAGKTTAVKLILGLARPDEGRALLFGDDPGLAATRRRMGAMLQISKVPETLKVREHLELFASYYPRPRPIGELLERVGLARLAERPYGKLSGGEKQRLLFALALVGDPDLLVLDEPTVGLDVESRRTLWKEIRAAVGEGRSVLLTTHYLDEADALADRVLVIHHGKILAEGKPSEIKARTAGRRVRCVTRLRPEEVDGWPEVTSAKWDGPYLEALAPSAEAVVRKLLDRDPALTGLEVVPASLEEAFLTLTDDSIPEGAAR
jgi:ABC-2 type transport system ATP-binding protein